MKKKGLLFLICSVIVLFGAGEAMADAPKGFGISAAYATTSLSKDKLTDEEYKGNSIPPFGLDYQWALGKSFSLGITGSEFGLTSITYASIPEIKLAKIDSLGFETNLWFDSFFVGLHLTQYSVVFLREDASIYAIGMKSGAGGVIGIEGKSGWFVKLRTDSSKDLTTDKEPVVDLNGFQLHFGYRWK
ncbi:MAG: hypothetical protein OEY59_02310 [Deltaproteobacteria bacterium]|nr:hypothetical protein [Deltaproteobacteria bacterium]